VAGGGGGVSLPLTKSVSQSWFRAPSGTYDQMFTSLKTACFKILGVIPEGMTGLSFNGSQCLILLCLVFLYKFFILSFIFFSYGPGAHPASYPVGTRGSFPGGKALGCGLDDRRFESRQGLGIFLFPTVSTDRLWGPTGTLTLYLGVKRPGREAYTSYLHLVSNSVMHGALPPFPQYAFMAWCSVKNITVQL
jgi:hypothetical protein